VPNNDTSHCFDVLPSTSTDINFNESSEPTNTTNISSHVISNNHHMVTRAKANVFKPKINTLHNSCIPSEPTSVKQALSSPNW